MGIVLTQCQDRWSGWWTDGQVDQRKKEDTTYSLPVEFSLLPRGEVDGTGERTVMSSLLHSSYSQIDHSTSVH